LLPTGLNPISSRSSPQPCGENNIIELVDLDSEEVINSYNFSVNYQGRSPRFFTDDYSLGFHFIPKNLITTFNLRNYNESFQAITNNFTYDDGIIESLYQYDAKLRASGVLFPKLHYGKTNFVWTYKNDLIINGEEVSNFQLGFSVLDITSPNSEVEKHIFQLTELFSIPPQGSYLTFKDKGLSNNWVYFFFELNHNSGRQLLFAIIDSNNTSNRYIRQFPINRFIGGPIFSTNHSVAVIGKLSTFYFFNLHTGSVHSLYNTTFNKVNSLGIRQFDNETILVKQFNLTNSLHWYSLNLTSNSVREYHSFYKFYVPIIQANNYLLGRRSILLFENCPEPIFETRLPSSAISSEPSSSISTPIVSSFVERKTQSSLPKGTTNFYNLSVLAVLILLYLYRKKKL
jgi:hypothetical protein